MRRVLRYKSAFCWMIIVFAVGFVVFNYNIQAKLTGMFEDQDAEACSYKYSSTVWVVPVMETYDDGADYGKYLLDAVEQMQNEHVKVTMIDIPSVVNDYGIEVMSELSLGGSTLKYPLVSGDYPTDEQLALGGRYAVIGRNRLRYVYTRDGIKYINLNGYSYRVTGCVSTGKSYYLDNKVILYDFGDGEAYWKKLNDFIIMGMGNITFESDYIDVGNIVVKEFQEILYNSSGGMLEAQIVSDFALGFTTSHVPKLQYRKWAWLAYAFCVLSIFFMFQYWLMRRQREFAIKKTFGMSALRITVQFMSEALLSMLVGTAIGMIFVVVSDSIAAGFVSFNFEMACYMAIILAGYIALTLLLTGIYPLIRLSCVNPVDLFNNKRGGLKK